MHGNYLEVIPDDFGIFTKLDRLYLGDNDLISLPDIFGSLPNLKKASFKMNSLTRLPPSFASLHSLENLDVSDNAMIKFPQPILKLKSLKFLNIERNRIQRLTPTEEKDHELYKSTFEFINQLSHLQLKGNPVYQHECLKDQRTILECLKEEGTFKKLSEIEPTLSLRVNLLGGSGAGKTSLVQALTLEKYVIPTTQKEHRHTVGIDRYYLPVEIGGKTVLLHIWDHAGDDEYAMMNDLFISNRSLVWLVVNLNKYCPSAEKQDQHIFQKFVGHWLLQVMSHNLKPIVWIICTHTDVSQGNNLKTKHMKYWASELFTKKMSKTCLLQHTDELSTDVPEFLKKHLKVIELTNTYGFEGLKQIYDNLETLPDKSEGAFSCLTKPLPINWEKVMDCLQLHAEENVNPLTSSKLPTISTTVLGRVVNLPDNFDYDSFFEYHHDIGEIYLIKSSSMDGGKETLAVLNLNWMINLLKKVYHHDFDAELDKARCQVEFEVIDDYTFDDTKVKREVGFNFRTYIEAPMEVQ